MRAISWPRLAEPFPAEAVRWHAAAADADAGRVRLAPHLAASALRTRLDEAAGPDAWSLRLRPWREHGLIAELTVGEAVRTAALATVPTGTFRGRPDDDLEEAAAVDAAEVAFAVAAVGFGAVPPVVPEDGGWVEAVPGEGRDGSELRPLHLPAARPNGDRPASAPPEPDRDPGAPAEGSTRGGTVPGGAVPEGGTRAAGPDDGLDEGQRVIVRLIDRLREEGLGAEAAKRVTAHGGYGSTPDARRELYADLRALLKERSAAG